ncbi:MAG: hypothetical protein AABY99_06850 [Pseudomonadota bacterium]
MLTCVLSRAQNPILIQLSTGSIDALRGIKHGGGTAGWAHYHRKKLDKKIIRPTAHYTGLRKENFYLLINEISNTSTQTELSM